MILLVVAVSAQANLDLKRFDAISNYWEWSSYFGVDGLDFPLAKYREGSSFSALVFLDDYPLDRTGYGSSEGYWGFCSLEIRVCQAYNADSNGAVKQAHGTKMRSGETEEQALARFRMQGFEQEWAGPAPVSKTQPSSQGTGGPPTIDPLAGPVSVDPYTIRTIRRRVTLPTLGIPSAIRSKLSNSKAESEVKRVMYEPNSRSGCTIVVPFADNRVGNLPVLVDCPKGTSVTVMSKHHDDWFFTHGGVVEGKATIDRLASRIRASASLTLKE